MLAIEKRFELNGELVGLVREDVTLEIGAVGRGVFTVRQAEAPALGVARFLVGLSDQGTVFPVLVGAAIERAMIGPGVWAVTVRDPAALLDLPADFAIRHCTPGDVLAEITGRTGIEFALPAAWPQLLQRIPHFAGAETCRSALDALGACWGADTVWCSLADGRVYWGPWSQGPWGTEPVQIDPALVAGREPRALTLPALPQLRPGVAIEDVAAGTGPVMVQRVEYRGGMKGSTMRVAWGDVE